LWNVQLECDGVVLARNVGEISHDLPKGVEVTVDAAQSVDEHVPGLQVACPFDDTLKLFVEPGVSVRPGTQRGPTPLSTKFGGMEVSDAKRLAPRKSERL
jgi:hypothetical protein